MIQQFGIDRTLYVLANTLRVRANYGRISRKNRDWADSCPVIQDIHHMEILPFKSQEISPAEHHRGTFAIISKDENLQQPIQGRRSVRAKLKEKAPSAPKPPSEKKKREPER